MLSSSFDRVSDDIQFCRITWAVLLEWAALRTEGVRAVTQIKELILCVGGAVLKGMPGGMVWGAKHFDWLKELTQVASTMQ